MAVKNPLTEQDLAALKTALEDSKDADQLIEMAQRAGLDVKVFSDRNREARERLTRIKNTFFPGA